MLRQVWFERLGSSAIPHQETWLVRQKEKLKWVKIENLDSQQLCSSLSGSRMFLDTS